MVMRRGKDRVQKRFKEKRKSKEIKIKRRIGSVRTMREREEEEEKELVNGRVTVIDTRIHRSMNTEFSVKKISSILPTQHINVISISITYLLCFILLHSTLS